MSHNIQAAQTMKGWFIFEAFLLILLVLLFSYYRFRFLSHLVTIVDRKIMATSTLM